MSTSFLPLARGARSQLTYLDRFRTVMNFQPADRLPMIEWAGWWHLTLERWHREGLPEELQDAGSIRDWLGLDCHRQRWLWAIGPNVRPRTHLSEGLASNMDEYLALKADLFPPVDLTDDPAPCWAAAHARGEMVVWITLEGFFWFPRSVLGIENHLYAFHDQPELIHRINDDLADHNLRMLDAFCRVCPADYMTFAEDMSYNHGPMLSKAAFDEFLAPYYRRIVPALKERGILPMVDSDGDVTALISWLEEVGIEGILPLERMAGVDVAAIRARHPRFRMIGAFDKTVMKEGEAAMRREFERLLPVMRTGGFIPSVDHQTPPDVSLETYRVYLRLLREYCASGKI